MPQSSLRIVAIFLATLLAIIIVCFFLTVIQLPPSPYSRLMIATCLTMLLVIGTTSLWTFFPGISMAFGSAISTLSMMIDLTVDLVLNLEFLKVLAPYATGISPTVITQCQIAACIGTIPFILFSFRWYLPSSWGSFIPIVRLIWPSIVGATELMQHIYLVYFVLRHLKTATRKFILLYCGSVVFALGVGCGGLVSIYQLTDSSEATLSFIVVLALPFYQIWTFYRMVLLRDALDQLRRRRMRMEKKAAAKAQGNGGSPDAGVKRKKSDNQNESPRICDNADNNRKSVDAPTPASSMKMYNEVE